MHAENESGMNRNEAVLDNLPGELYIIKYNGKITTTDNNSSWSELKV